MVQAICFNETVEYVSKQRDLLNVVSPEERVIIETFIGLKNGGAVDFERMSENLFNWSKGWINKI